PDTFTLASGAERDLHLSFLPTEVGPADATLELSLTGSDMARVHLHGVGLKGCGQSCVDECAAKPAGACFARARCTECGSCVFDPIPGAGWDGADPCTVSDTCDGAGVCRATAISCQRPPAARRSSANTLSRVTGPGTGPGRQCQY